MVGLKLPVNGVNHYTTVDCRICPHNWWYQAPRIIETFLESYDFSGKTVIPFATSGGSGMGGEDILKAACSKDTKWLPGKRLSSRESAASVQKWVESLGL